MNDTDHTFRRRLALYTVGAVALALLSSAGNYASAIAAGETPHVVAMLAWSLAGWALWLLLVPGMMLLARRLPVGGAGTARNVVAHLFLALLFVAVHEAIYISAIVALEPGIVADPGLTRVVMARLSAYGVLGLMVYFAVLATEHFLDSRERARRRELRAARLEAELADARLQALARQLQPHFLFNTLNAATGLLREGRADAAADVLVHLGDLLRDSLDRMDRSVVTLEQEQRTLERYLAIQNVRFGDRIETVVDIPAATRSARLPHFLLQPLVENAFQHGLGDRAERGAVTVRSRREGDRLRLEVLDTGNGFADAPGSGAASGTGLRNARARLREVFGDDFTLACDTQGGARVRIDVPFRTEAS